MKIFKLRPQKMHHNVIVILIGVWTAVGFNMTIHLSIFYKEISAQVFFKIIDHLGGARD